MGRGEARGLAHGEKAASRSLPCRANVLVNTPSDATCETNYTMLVICGDFLDKSGPECEKVGNESDIRSDAAAVRLPSCPFRCSLPNIWAQHGFLTTQHFSSCNCVRITALICLAFDQWLAGFPMLRPAPGVSHMICLSNSQPCTPGKSCSVEGNPYRNLWSGLLGHLPSARVENTGAPKCYASTSLKAGRLENISAAKGLPLGMPP